MQDSAAVELGAVPETLLWTLYLRAAEAQRPDSVFRLSVLLARFG